jgi:YgiT-type zinc finger domain-containing protein
MIGEHEKHNGRCALCGGHLDANRRATIPFVLENAVVVVRDVPAEVCRNCREPYMTGAVTDRITQLLRQLHTLQTEVTVVSYAALREAA